jgi:DNA-binding IclR family transcriptional regulator
VTTSRTEGRRNSEPRDARTLDAETEGDEGAAGGLRSLDRPFVILRVLRENRVPMRLTEIATAASLHLATTQRIVNLLIKHGYVEREGLDYRLGITSLLNGATFLLTNSLTQIAEPILHQVTASTGLTSTLSVRYDLSQVLLLRVPSTPPLRYQLPVGEQTPLVVGGARVLAAALSTEDLDRLLEGVDNIPLASGLVLGRQEFIDSLQVIRERGYAFGQGQREAGAMSIAVPVMNREGEVIASIQLSSMIEDIPKDVDALVMELKRASAAISRRIP